MCYIAPHYPKGNAICDPDLLVWIEARKPRLNSHKGTKTLTGFFATFYAPGFSAFLRLPKLTLV